MKWPMATQVGKTRKFGRWALPLMIDRAGRSWTPEHKKYTRCISIFSLNPTKGVVSNKHDEVDPDDQAVITKSVLLNESPTKQ